MFRTHKPRRRVAQAFLAALALMFSLTAVPPGASAAQSPILVVDQFTGFDPAVDTTDGVHPDDSGFQKMSDRWYPALIPFLNGQTPQPPGPPGTPAASGVTASYEVFRAAGASGGTFTQIAQPAGSPFTDTGLTPGSTYRYRVRARDTQNNTGPFTPIVTGTTGGGGGGPCSMSRPRTSAQGFNGCARRG